MSTTDGEQHHLDQYLAVLHKRRMKGKTGRNTLLTAQLHLHVCLEALNHFIPSPVIGPGRSGTDRSLLAECAGVTRRGNPSRVEKRARRHNQSEFAGRCSARDFTAVGRISAVRYRLLLSPQAFKSFEESPKIPVTTASEFGV